MKNIHFFTAIPLAFMLLLIGNLRVSQMNRIHSLSEPESKLIIDTEFITYLNKQVAKDVPEEVVIFADSIIITAKDTFRNFNLLLYANYLDIKNRLIVTPALDSGQNGKSVIIFAKKLERSDISIPGNPGKTGKKGKSGKDGDPKNLIGDKISPGTRGEPGLKGEKGGDGGNLIVHSLNNTYTLNFSAKGGRGGEGGAGGQGGLTYFRPITKIINQGKPNEKIIYGATQSRREGAGVRGPAGDNGKDGTVTKMWSLT